MRRPARRPRASARTARSTSALPYGGTPTIFENVAIIGAASGEVPQGPAGNPRAFDVRTGAKLWEFQTVPRAGEPFNETWGNGWENRGGTNMWAFAAPVDARARHRLSADRGPRGQLLRRRPPR